MNRNSIATLRGFKPKETVGIGAALVDAEIIKSELMRWMPAPDGIEFARVVLQDQSEEGIHVQDQHIGD